MAKGKIAKTNVARLLDSAKINYQLISYQVDESDLSAVHVAEQLGENVKQVFKTLVLKGDKTGFIVCIIPGDAELNLKKTAKESDNKSVEMLSMKELLPVTGYIRGGCSPIGMKKSFQTFIDESCWMHETIYISAGIRGLQVQLAPSDLVEYIMGRIGDLID